MASGDSRTDRAARRRGTSRGGRVEQPGRTDYRNAERYDNERYDDELDDDTYAEGPDDGTYDEEPVSARVAATSGLRHVAALTGKTVIGVTSLDRTEHGWLVGVEVVEDARIPSSADILAVYRTELDAAGDLLGYRRTRRYPRGRGDTGNGLG